MSKLGAIRAAWGAALLLAPDAVLRAVGGRPDALARRVSRVLGARELVQARLAAGHRSCSAAWAGALVDATHAATMLALAIRRPTYRRPAAASALTAASFAIAGLRAALATQAPPSRSRPNRASARARSADAAGPA
jgi:hypothetical protein